MLHDAAFHALVDIILEDADRGSRRAEDQAVNEARRLVIDAEDHVRELSEAAKNLGRVRGEAAKDAARLEAEREVASLRAEAFTQLYDRFARRLTLSIQSLPDTEDYVGALRHWAREAAAVDGPMEVFAAKRDRLAVYEALLDQGATDFSVHVDRRCVTGFVVRDLDGRVVLDRRPNALIETHETALQALLREGVAPYA